MSSDSPVDRHVRNIYSQALGFHYEGDLVELQHLVEVMRFSRRPLLLPPELTYEEGLREIDDFYSPRPEPSEPLQNEVELHQATDNVFIHDEQADTNTTAASLLAQNPSPTAFTSANNTPGVTTQAARSYDDAPVHSRLQELLSSSRPILQRARRIGDGMGRVGDSTTNVGKKDLLDEMATEEDTKLAPTRQLRTASSFRENLTPKLVQSSSQKEEFQSRSSSLGLSSETRSESADPVVSQVPDRTYLVRKSSNLDTDLVDRPS